MNWLKRIGGNVATRVAVGLILAALFAIFGTSKAHASDFADQGQAYHACMTGRAALLAAFPGAIPNSPGWDCSVVQASGTQYKCQYYTGAVRGCDYYYVGSGSTLASEFNFPANKTCNHRVEQTSWMPTSGPVCFQGCKYYGYTDASAGNYFSTCNDTNPDPTGVTCGTGSGATCTTAQFPPPDTDADGDGVPDSEDAFPNDPNESADSDGDGIGDNADFAPEDPTDGSDTPGEEDGDDEGDNVAGGGANCGSPPTCAGDGIQCAQLFQLWQLRCEGTAHGTVAGDAGTCGALAVASPDPVANAQLRALHAIACNTEGDDDPGTGGAVGDANGNGVADVLEGAGSDGVDPGGEDDVTQFGLGLTPDLLDQENIFGGGQCPTAPSFPIMGTTINPADMPYFCDIMAIARVLILLMGAFTALKILLGGNF